jgi:heme oxygenase (biliverdin-IX-beta and delta-forming)
MQIRKSELVGDGEIVRLPSGAAGLREALRAATSEVHERLHGHDGFAAVQAGTIDGKAYRHLLSRLYGFYRPFEAAARLAPQRTRWLEQDLEALGVCAVSRVTLPRCAAFPPRLCPDHVLGARYVVEGSALGGRGMARQLDALLGPGVMAGRQFFSGHGADTGSAWRDYLALLAREPRPMPQCSAIIDGANATFATFEHWLAGWNIDHG